MNTGEGRPQEPVRLERVEPADCSFVDCVLAGISQAVFDVTTANVEGIPVTDIAEAHEIGQPSGATWL